MSDDSLDHNLLVASEAVNAWTAALAVLVAEVSRRAHVVRGDGHRGVASWLSAKLDVSSATARSVVTLAAALEDRPQVTAALASGEVSVDRARLLGRLAETADDSSVMERLAGLNIAQLEDLARAARPEPVVPEASSVRLREGRDGTHRLSGVLVGDDGERVAAALAREAETIWREQSDAEGPQLSYDQRLGQALVNMASARIASDAYADRATVFIYQPVDGPARLGRSGHPVVSETFDRLCCDSRMHTVTDDNGRIIGLSEPSRTASPKMQRLLKIRDRRCRFPGCEATRFLHAHHAQHAEHGGATSTQNLILICPWHHKLCHEGGWHIEMDASGTGAATFIDPTGRTPHETRPQPAAA